MSTPWDQHYTQENTGTGPGASSEQSASSIEWAASGFDGGNQLQGWYGQQPMAYNPEFDGTFGDMLAGAPYQGSNDAGQNSWQPGMDENWQGASTSAGHVMHSHTQASAAWQAEGNLWPYGDPGTVGMYPSQTQGAPVFDEAVMHPHTQASAAWQAEGNLWPYGDPGTVSMYPSQTQGAPVFDEATWAGVVSGDELSQPSTLLIYPRNGIKYPTFTDQDWARIRILFNARPSEHEGSFAVLRGKYDPYTRADLIEIDWQHGVGGGYPDQTIPLYRQGGSGPLNPADQAAVNDLMLSGRSARDIEHELNQLRRRRAKARPKEQRRPQVPRQRRGPLG